MKKIIINRKVDYKSLQEFNDRFDKENELTIEERYKILDAMWLEAKEMGILDKLDPFDGIDKKISWKRIINCLKK